MACSLVTRLLWFPVLAVPVANRKWNGLSVAEVVHAGNKNTSPQEVEVVRALIAEMLAAQAVWVNCNGERQVVGEEDVLVMAPYNAHVAALRRALPDGVRVGTVDKFQGREAPVVIYSMATSSAEDAPRGMEFLYGLNRMNVATSRARCLSVLVASPALVGPECRRVGQMVLANALCRFVEGAGGGS